MLYFKNNVLKFFFLKIICTGFLLSFQALASEGIKNLECIKIYYNKNDLEYPMYLQNLLGHFPKFQQILEPINNYKKGGLEECKASFYLGTNTDEKIPEEFLNDFEQTKKSVTWMGFSIQLLGDERLSKLFGHRYQGMVSLDQEHKDSKGRPTFFKSIHYKGEIFEKYGEYTSDGKTFRSSYPMVTLTRVGPNGEVLAEAEHNFSKEQLPYIIRGGNHFYIADVPFTYRTDSDRYLVFSDLLFDILETPPLYPDKHPALIRIEDVNVTTPQDTLVKLVKTLHSDQVPNGIALIPIYSDPLNPEGHDPTGLGVSVDQVPAFAATLKTIKDLGTTFVWHGVTHQYGRHKNPHGVTSDDFEFVISSTGKPIPEDSVTYVLDLLNRGWAVLSKVGIKPSIWEVPHYAASALDYTIFARTFAWNYGKIRYIPHTVSGLNNSVGNSIWYETSGLDGDSERKDSFANLRVTETGESSMQYFPYEIYGDVYGQRILPEDLDYPRVQSPGIPARSFDDILACAKRNRVIRDSWASLFLHISYIRRLDAQTPPQNGRGIRTTQDLIKQIRALGYEFISADEFVSNHKEVMRPVPIFR